MCEGKLGAGGRIEGSANGLKLTSTRNEVRMQVRLDACNDVPAPLLRLL